MAEKENTSHAVFSSDEKRLELLGQIFGNITSRKIISDLAEKEMTATEISEKTGIKLNLVLYHLEKMLKLEVINVTKTTRNSRGHKVKHYRAKQAVMILSRKSMIKAKKSKTFSDALKRITRISSIGIAGFVTWFASGNFQVKISGNIEESFKYPRPTLPEYMNPIQAQVGTSEFVVPIVLGAIVVGMLVFVDRLVMRRISNK